MFVTITEDEDSIVRQNAAYPFRNFSDFPDKEVAWADLHRLTEDENSIVRQNAVVAFQKSFSYFPDKEVAWADLHRLTEDEDSIVRQNAAYAFRNFSDFPDKEVAWADLHRLTEDEDSIVRQNAALAFRNFSDFPDKENAWADLHRLTEDENSIVRQNTAFILSRIYEKVSDKGKIFEWLSILVNDESFNVKALSNYSIAKIYVYKSLEGSTEQEFIENYIKAIQFFKNAYDIRNKWNITEFCFTIHNLFYRILIGDIKNAEEIRNKIILLENRSLKSDDYQYLLDILDSLGNVLEESLIAKNSGENVWRYREKVLPHCTRVDELIESLSHQGIGKIAKKAREQVEKEYLKTINLLNKINKLIDNPNLIENQLIPTIHEFCELISNPVIKDKVKQDLT